MMTQARWGVEFRMLTILVEVINSVGGVHKDAWGAISPCNELAAATVMNPRRLTESAFRMKHSGRIKVMSRRHGNYD